MFKFLVYNYFIMYMPLRLKYQKKNRQKNKDNILTFKFSNRLIKTYNKHKYVILYVCRIDNLHYFK